MNERKLTQALSPSRREFLVAAASSAMLWGGGQATGLDPVTVTPTMRWRATIATEGQVEAAIDDVVFVRDGEGSIAALELDSGTERWRFDTGDESVRQIETGNEAVYARTESGMYAVSVDSGARSWSVEPSGHSRTLAVEDEGVFVGTDSGVVRRVSHADGTVVWQASVAGTPWRTAGTDTDALFVGTNSGVVMALELEDGSRRWQFELSGHGGSYDDGPRISPIAVDAASRTLFVWNGEERALRALSARDGTEQWRVRPETGGSGFRGDVVPGSVYVPDGRTVRALDPRDGSEQGRVEVDTSLSELQIGDAGVVAAGVGAVYGVSPSKQRVRWRYDTGRDQALLLSGTTKDRIVASEVYGVLHVLSGDGSLQWEHDLDAPLHGTPLVADDTVVAGTKAGTVYAATDPPGTPGTAAKRTLDTNRSFSLATGLVGGGLIAAGYRWFRE